MTSSSSKNLILAIVLVIVAVLAWGILIMPDNRSTGQKIGDAVNALPNGVDRAARELEDRTPGEKLGDAVKDAGDDIKQKTDR